MTGRVVSVGALLVVLTSCVSYTGGAHSIDPDRLVGAGWIVAAPTPELHQRGAKDCGAAALAMIAGRWDVALSVEDAVAELPAPTKQGSKLGDLRDAARAHGLVAFAIAGDRDTLLHELGAGRPVVVGLLLPFGSNRVKSHFEVIIAAHPARDQFVTINPSRGWRTRSWAALDAEWRPAGRAALVVLGREGTFAASRSATIQPSL